MSERITIVAATNAHAAQLAEFFRLSWNADATAESVNDAFERAARDNQADPGTSLPTYIALQGERVVGYCSSLAIRLWDGATEQPAYWAKGLMVLPEFRNGPIGFSVLKELTKHVPRIAAVTVHPASKRLFTALGYHDHGALPNRLKPLSIRRLATRIDLNRVAMTRLPRPARILAQALQFTGLAAAAGFAADLLIRCCTPSASARMRRGTGVVKAAELDALWRRVRPSISAATVRDGAALLARYGDGASVPDYRYATVHRDGVLIAVGIVRRPRLDGDPRLAGVRVASFSDLLVDVRDREATTAVLVAAEQLATDLGADALLSSASNATLAPMLSRRGYLAFRGNVHFFLRAPTADRSWPEGIGAWWLARGDGESDVTF